MDATKFWGIIDNAWKSDPELQQFQNAVLKTIGSDSERKSFYSGFGLEACIPKESKFIGAVSQQLDLLPEDELLTFDRVIEQKLFDIDRKDIHDYTDGSEDGFLYCRGFIVAMGKEFYEAVNQEPSNALIDFGCYEFTYLAKELFEEKFGEMPSSDISRESCSNAAGWQA